MFSNTKQYLLSLDLMSELPENKVDHILKGIIDLLKQIISESDLQVLQKCKYTTETVTDDLVKEVSDYFNTRIYFIDAKTRLPRRLLPSGNYRNSIIILEFVPEKYEIVGELTQNNIVKREFQSADKIICEIQDYLSTGRSSSTKPSINKINSDSEDDISDSEITRNWNLAMMIPEISFKKNFQKFDLDFTKIKLSCV